MRKGVKDTLVNFLCHFRHTEIARRTKKDHKTLVHFEKQHHTITPAVRVNFTSL